MNTKMKKRIRKIVAGLCLASAVAVAAIPADNSGVARADQNEVLSYTSDSSLSRNNDLKNPTSGAPNLSSASQTIRTSYEIRQIDGAWNLIWKYEYFVPTAGVGGNTGVGVISGYNDSYNVQQLSLSSNIITAYQIIPKSTFDSYVTTTINNITYTLDKSPYEATMSGGNANSRDALADVQKYFSNNYNTWKNQYDSALASWKNSNPNSSHTPSLEELSMTPLVLNGTDMTDENKRLYYCDYNSMPGYTLIPVNNQAGGKKWITDSNGTETTITTETTVYAFQRVADNGSIDNIDDNNFKYLNHQTVIAIGDKAFYQTEKVNSMVVGEGITAIGDGAFQESFIQNVEFDSVIYIGNRVFKDCQYLTDIRLSSHTTTIGKEAFYGCRILREISIPEGVKEIGFGAFANCPVLGTVDLSNSKGTNIGEYAFYDCAGLSTVQFPEASYEISIGKAAFALTPGNGTSASMTEFTFPANIGTYESAADSSFTQYTLYDENNASYQSRIGDYILAGRSGLLFVTMPLNFGSSTTERIPMNTFYGCSGLANLRFAQDNNRMATYDSTLFKDVMNPRFYVFGPELTLDGDYAAPRQATWKASTGVSDYVPYVYNANGRDHYEVGIDPYRYELQIHEDDGTATILSCRFIDINDPEDIEVLIVPGTVADYTITELAEGCFNGTNATNGVKNHIKNLIVEDNSILNIGDSVFDNCTLLETVTLGNSVQTIGENTFANNNNLTDVVIGGGIVSIGENAFNNCPELEHVIWNSPSSYSRLTSIADNAFYTTGEKLYFEGDIESGYAPFEYAMGNHAINNSSIRICYVMPMPNTHDVNRILDDDGKTTGIEINMPSTAVYVIKDEESGENLLIDYPHYFDLPQEIRKIYEGTTPGSLNNEQRAMLDATLYISLPEEVTSIDVKSFLANGSNNQNRKNWIYIDDTDPFGTENRDYTQRAIYSDDDLTLGGSEEDSDILLKEFYETGYHAGLFSGFYYDTTALRAYGEDTATIAGYDAKGNDWILSISMPGVTSIPDYAFDSCERLQSIIISDACQKIGTGAFQDCVALRTIGTGDSKKFIFDNYLLYEVLDDGTYELNVCLPARGESGSGSEIWVNTANDPLLSKVSSLNDNVFTNCNGIITVDLSSTSIKRVPNETFKGCSSLYSVTLPSTITAIGDDAFKGVSRVLDVTVPRDCQLPRQAFDDNCTVTIWTYPECELITGEYGEEGDNIYPNIHVRYLGSTYTITFLNDDNSVYEVMEVASGGNGALPVKDPTPKLPAHAGYEFDGWYFDNDNTIYNVTENRVAIATFVDPIASKTFTITYYNDDMSVYEVITVLGGYNGYYPTVNPEPKLAMHQGYQFSGWNFDNEKGIVDVRENRQAVATFSLNGTNTPSANQPGNGNGNGGNGNGGNGTTSGNSASGNSASGNNVSSNGVTYTVVVENGAGGGSYEPGKVVTITAYAAPTGRVFDRWTTSNADIGFSNAYAVSTTFIMPSHDVKVTATYKQETASGNSANGNNNNNNSNGNNSGNGSSASGNNANGSNGKTDVTITTDTIDNNHKNLASATVSGSTDNFIVKITDSAAAYAAVEQALRAQYGDLSNVMFVGFDISLYDETGTRKIENTNGLAVTITIPIPDDLVPYAGNNRAAGVVNGALDPLTVKFTTIDGVPCMQFTATHFSPYTIYVNTNYLTMGVTDETPKTGDGLHPKWFLAAGLACFSVVLFAWKDKKKVIVK